MISIAFAHAKLSLTLNTAELQPAKQVPLMHQANFPCHHFVVITTLPV
jgi:hypothetical protein